VRRRLTVVPATSLAAALLALAQPVAGPAVAARTPGSTPTGATPTHATGTTGATTDPAAPTVDRIVTDPRITEASGLVSSVRHQGLVWTHEDSGHPARIFALDASGTTVATLALRGVQNVDWESMTITRDNAGRYLLAVGDIGDNNSVRPDVRVLLVREPTALKNAKVAVQRVIRLTYPNGATDAETLVADPRTRRLYVVTKGILGGELYAVPPQVWPGGSDAGVEARSWPLTLVARVDMSLVTDGTFLPDGRLVLRNYGSMTVYADPTKSKGALTPLSTMVLPSQPQGESLALGPGATSLLIGSEGSRQPLMRVALPTGITTPVTDTGSATPTATDAVNAQRTAATDEGGGLPPFLLLVVAAGVVLLLLIFGAVLIALR
jgi:hypothetical protein